MTHDWVAIQAELVDLLVAGAEGPAIEWTRQVLAQGATPLEFFQKAIVPGLAEIGRRFEELEIFLPELAVAGDTVKAISREVINPALAEDTRGRMELGKVVLGTVQGDLHDIGKNMVALMLGVQGFTVVDLGTNVSPAEFIARAEEERADIIAMSALLMTCLPYMKDVLDRLSGMELRHKYVVVVGGAPTSPEYARSIGADAYGANAAEAVRICKNLMQRTQQTA